jgi:hypothetical protein
VNTVEAEHIFLENLYRINGKVLVVLQAPWSSYKPEEITLLTKILGSVKLSIEGVQVLCKESVTIKELLNYEPSFILLFGINFTPSIKTYTAETLEGITVINAESLSSLDDIKKKNLWLALKQGFKL